MRKSDCCHHFTSFFLYLFRVAHASFPYPPDLSPLSHQRLFSVSLLLCWVPHLSLPPETHTHISITFSGLEQRLAIQPLKPTRGLEMELLCEYTSLLVVVYTRTHKGVSPIDWLTKLLPCRRPGKQQAKQFTFYERLHRNWYSAYLLQKWLICLLIVQMIQALSCLHYDCLLLTVRFMSFQTFRSTNTHNNRQTDVTVTCLGRSRQAQNGKIKA